MSMSEGRHWRPDRIKKRRIYRRINCATPVRAEQRDGAYTTKLSARVVRMTLRAREGARGKRERSKEGERRVAVIKPLVSAKMARQLHGMLMARIPAACSPLITTRRDCEGQYEKEEGQYDRVSKSSGASTRAGREPSGQGKPKSGAKVHRKSPLPVPS